MYGKQIIPWVCLFLFFNASILFLGYLDPDIPNISVNYIVVINTVGLIVFVIWLYLRDRNFWNEFITLEELGEIESLPIPESPVHKKIHDQLFVMKRHHDELLEKESSKTSENLDALTRWIHEMKMPLTTMKLLIDDLEPGYKARIEAEWVRLDRSLNDMLFERRLQNISNDLYVEKVEIERVLTNTIKQLRSMCVQKGIGFQFDLELTHIKTDLKWFSFMLDQVIGNSVKYARDSDITISSYLNEGWPKIVISDCGRGIKEEDIPRVFEANFTSTSDHGDMRATGMGLYLTKEAANALQIDVDIQSRYNEGTTVTFTFPKANHYHYLGSM